MNKRSSFLAFALPDLGDEELSEVAEVLRTGWITTGPKAQSFERAFADYVGVKHAVAVNSCTAAMHLALDAVGVRRGDFVLTSAYTFAATAEVIRYFDAVPVFVDVEPNTLNMDSVLLERTITDLKVFLAEGKTPRLPAVMRAVGTRLREADSMSAVRSPHGTIKAVIPVHIAGHPCEMDDIAAVAHRHQLPVIEDAAHACSAFFRSKAIGSTFTVDAQSAACFSFYATKTLATGEGGMVTTDNEEYADRIRLMSLHGISKDAWKRYTAQGHWYYEIIAPGYKYNMPDVIAAIGLAQLRKVDAMRERREAIARRYDEAFRDLSEVETPTVRSHVKHAWHLYVLRLYTDALSIARDEFIDQLKRLNIGSSVHFIPLHVHPYYRDTYGYRPEDLPTTLCEYRRAISLPIYSKMTDFDVDCVIDAVSDIVSRHRVRSSYASVGR